MGLQLLGLGVVLGLGVGLGVLAWAWAGVGVRGGTDARAGQCYSLPKLLKGIENVFIYVHVVGDMPSRNLLSKTATLVAGISTQSR